ncbi:MAG: putative entry exclusion protein TrbK-alt [Rudaea sp.]|nr:putative entry exclusion protein TrbK-alt [Rudaea sp.]
MRTAFRKGRLINWHFVGPVIGYALTAVAIVATVVHVTHRSEQFAGSPPDAVHLTSNDRLARELARCQAVGARAENDSDCITAWAENRRRFFNDGATTTHPASALAARAKSGEAALP